MVLAPGREGPNPQRCSAGDEAFPALEIPGAPESRVKWPIPMPSGAAAAHGQALFGYKTVQLKRGEERKGRAIVKSIWVLDDTTVNGRPMHEWARECLSMAAKGASLDELRDFCNENGVPARRKEFWSQSTWNSLLQPAVLMKYCGHEVWNVHRKNGTRRPPEEWLVVENAHPALITEEEALAIRSGPGADTKKRFDRHNRHRKQSRYLLSGGLFKCGRCGANMVGYRSTAGYYYLCGSQSYRRGLGCGAGVYVRQTDVESEVIAGVRELAEKCADRKRFASLVNEEIRKVWRQAVGHDPNAEKQLAQIDRKQANVGRAIADGCEDIAWANAELRRLDAERAKLTPASAPLGKAPQIDAAMALAYRDQIERSLTKAGPDATRGLLRECVETVTLLPDSLEFEIGYTLPAAVMKEGSGSLSDAGAYRDRTGSGGWIRTSDLRVMSPTSFQTAPPRSSPR